MASKTVEVGRKVVELCETETGVEIVSVEDKLLRDVPLSIDYTIGEDPALDELIRDIWCAFESKGAHDSIDSIGRDADRFGLCVQMDGEDDLSAISGSEMSKFDICVYSIHDSEWFWMTRPSMVGDLYDN